MLIPSLETETERRFVQARGSRLRRSRHISMAGLIFRCGFHHVPLPPERFGDRPCLHGLVWRQASRRPDAVAVSDDFGQSLTYAELQQRARCLAAVLRAGIGRAPPEGAYVGVCVERNVSMVVCVLGILEAGFAWCPIGLRFPAARRRFVMEDARAVGAVVSASMAKDAEGWNPLPPSATFTVDAAGSVPRSMAVPPHAQARAAGASAMDRVPHGAPEYELDWTRPAYAYYTGGSTGNPKGVVVEHRNLVAILEWHDSLGVLDSGGTWLGVTELTHDPVLLDLFWPLSVGARLYVAGSETQRSGARLVDVLEREQITATAATPATFQLLIHGGWNGSPRLNALIGGEAFPVGLKAELSRCKSVYNVSGGRVVVMCLHECWLRAVVLAGK